MMDKLYLKALSFGIVEMFEIYNERRGTHLTSHKMIDFCDDPPKAKINFVMNEKDSFMGQAFHAATLEPETFKQDFIFMPRLEDHPDLDEYKNKKLTKIYKEMKADWMEENKGKKVLNRDDLHRLKCQSSAFADWSEFQELMKAGTQIKEMSFLSEVHGMKVQIKPDLMNFYDEKYDIFDIKTIANIERWWNQVNDFGYQLQLWFYAYVMEVILGEPPKRLIIAFVEKENPFRCLMVQVEPFLWIGPVKQYMDKKLLEYKEAKKTNLFVSKYGRKIENYINAKELMRDE